MTSRADGPPVLGVDLGGTKILAGVISADNKILGRGKRNTPAKEGGPAILQTMIECVNEAVQSSGVSLDEIAAGGIGSPGPLDPEKGVILFSANLNVKNYPIGPELSAFLKKPVILQNDVRVGGYGEFRLGAGRGYKDVIAAFVGTGIGGCVIQRGEIVTGSTGNAGEIGHVIVKEGGPLCGCGARGCMEALASKTAIQRRINKSLRKGKSTVLADKILRKGRLKSGDLAEAVASKDRVAVKAVRRAAHFLGLGLGGLVNVLGPEIVIIGGGVANALGDRWVELVAQTMREQILTDPEKTIKIQRASLGDDAAILGAALLARESLTTS